MKIKKTKGERIFDVFNVVLMLIIAFIMFYPMYHVLMASFSLSSNLITLRGPLFWPLGFTTSAYTYVFKNPAVFQGYKITLFVVIAGTLLSLALTSLSAYYISRKNQYLTGFVTVFILITMFFSGGMIPDYLNVRSLGLYNTIWALILPGAISTFNTIILRTAFLALPDSLEESARIDGANDFTILTRLYIPLSKAVMAVLTLYYGVALWNSWFSAMVYLRDANLYPLQLILRGILITNDTSSLYSVAADTTQMAETIKYALVIVVTVPILVLYPFLQKYFTKGVLVGAVKG